MENWEIKTKTHNEDDEGSKNARKWKTWSMKKTNKKLRQHFHLPGFFFLVCQLWPEIRWAKTNMESLEYYFDFDKWLPIIVIVKIIIISHLVHTSFLRVSSVCCDCLQKFYDTCVCVCACGVCIQKIYSFEMVNRLKHYFDNAYASV